MCALPVFIAMSSFERMVKNQTMMCWTSGDIFRPFAMNPIPCNHKTSEYSAIKLGLLQIKNTGYSGSNASIFMHFGKEFGELCSFSFCYFYFGIWRRVTLYEKDNNN